MKNFKKNMIICFMTLSAIVYSCSDPTNVEEAQQTIGSKGKLNSNLPTLSNGMLAFKDDASYQAYLDYLDAAPGMLTDNQVKQYTNDPRDIVDIVLDSIENNLGFNSLRAINHEKFEAENSIGWDKPELVPDIYSPGNRTEYSTLNEYGEVKIGDVIKKVLNNKKIIYIKTEPTIIADHLITETRALQEQYPDGNIPTALLRHLDYTSKYLIIDDFEIGNIFDDVPLDDIPLNQYAISGVIQYGNPCMGSINQITLRLFTLVQVTSWFNNEPGGTPTPAWYTVDFGNGVVSNSIQGNQGPANATFDQMYIYPAAGTYTITISARLTQNGPTVATRSYTVNVTGTATCSSSDKSISNIFYATSTQALKCDIRFWKYLHFPSFAYPRKGRAEAQNLIKSGNKWKVRKADRIAIAVQSLAFNRDCAPHGTTTFPTGYWLQSFNYENNARSFHQGSGPIHTYDLHYNTIEADFYVSINGSTHWKKYIMSACN